MKRLFFIFALILPVSVAYSQTLLSGSTSGKAPANSIGNESFWFLDTSTGSIYGPKTSSAWPGSPTSTIANWMATNPANLPAISSCGTSPPAATAGSNNNSGQFTFGTGTPTACTVTFNTPFVNSAYCTLSPASSGGAALTGGYYISAQSKTAFTLTIGTGTNSLVFNYNCEGN